MNASGTNVWPNTKIYSATLGTLALKGNQLENKANKYEHRARQQVKALASQMKEILPFLPKNTYPTETAQVCNCSGPEVTWGQRQESWKPPGKLACWAAENSTEANSKETLPQSWRKARANTNAVFWLLHEFHGRHVCKDTHKPSAALQYRNTPSFSYHHSLNSTA